jgi:acetyl-CoA synthetase
MDIVPVPPAFSSKAWIDAEKYHLLYAQSINDPESFWDEQSKALDWIKPYTSVTQGDFTGDVRVAWFADGTLNASQNCIDRHLDKHGDKTAIIWEPDDPTVPARHISYAELHRETCIFANILKRNGVQKGDRVIIYLPMIPEAAFAMLACARIGAVHSVVFAGFSPHSLIARIADCGAAFVITSDGAMRGGKKTLLKQNMDEALAACPGVNKALIVRHTGETVTMQPGRDVWLHDEKTKVNADCPAEEMSAEDPLFILYTSGSTGAPKGVLHTTGGYLLYAALTHKCVLDCHDKDIYWCSADIGWVTGHSYILYGPLANGATTVMFEGVPTFPDASRFWQVIDKHKVSIFYTAPTALRALMREGDNWVKKTSRASLRLLATVGEPINPEAWQWYYDVVGNARCPVVDTWWQTETGGHMIAPMPGAVPLKPGSAVLPFFGVEPVVVDQAGNILEGECEGMLCIAESWPGMMRSLYGDHDRFVKTYFSAFPGLYFTGDGCRRDKDGYYWITGRVDDVLNVSGHRLSTAEIESACVSFPSVAEAAVVGCPHDIKGQGIYIYVTLKVGITGTDDLKRQLGLHVRKEIGPIATPDFIQWAPALPKTRSGKIMRRILRKIAAHETDSLGDISTLADPSVVDDLIKNRAN